MKVSLLSISAITVTLKFPASVTNMGEHLPVTHQHRPPNRLDRNEGQYVRQEQSHHVTENVVWR